VEVGVLIHPGVLALGHRLIEAGVDRARFNQRDMPIAAQLVEFGVQPRTGGRQCEPGHAIGHQKGHRNPPGDRAHEQHCAVAPRDHAAQRELGQLQGGEHIHFESLAEAVHVDLGQRTRFAHAGVVDQHVQRLLQNLCAVAGRGDVEL